MSLTRPIAALFTLLAASLFAMGHAHAGKTEKAERLVTKSSDTLEFFLTDEPYETLRDVAADAKAIMVMPASKRGAFIVGASGGNALLVSRQPNGIWSHPVFYTLGSLSFGLQAGGEVSEIVLLIMTDRGKERILNSTVKIGADLTAAAGTLGGGAKAQTADIIAFSRSRGLYGGISLEGAVVKTRPSWNKAYYDRDLRPSDIILRNAGFNPQATSLRNAAAALGGGANAAAPVALTPQTLTPQGAAPQPLTP